MSELNTPHVDYERVYNIYRDYLQHEDDLINHRTTWLITIQSFLWATFGFSYQKRLEVFQRVIEKPESFDHIKRALLSFDLFMILLILVGFLTAFVTYFSVRAATRAIQNLQTQWEGENYPKGVRKVHHLNETIEGTADDRSIMNRPDVAYLPGITGGGSPSALKHGTYISKSLPILFCALWLITLLLLFT